MKMWVGCIFVSILLGLVENRDRGYSMMKEINGIIYVGGRNSLSSYTLQQNKLKKVASQVYQWPVGIMNGSDIGYTFYLSRWPNITLFNPSSMAFDTCLNWKQEHPDEAVRNSSFDYQHWQYHTPSGNWKIMNFTCMNSFIRAIEVIDNDTLWVCGTFGSFPRAFSVNRLSLKFLEFVDTNLMSCGRYMDEPMATYVDKNKNFYVASGWGLYKPDHRDPDIPENNSTMLYADWRLYRNLFTLPSTMSWVLSSDVNFINVVKETEDHLYFFGHEINNQYGLNNQEDRHAWQSFLLRICKSDLGFKYVPLDLGSTLKSMTTILYYTARVDGNDYKLSPIHEDICFNESWYHKSAHLPTKHFVNSQKINFGCYIGKRPRAISDNHFWGETNVVYFNKLADVIFDPNKKIQFKTKNNNKYFGCNSEPHSQTPLIGLFNKPGIRGTQVNPSGALCQLQINKNIFQEEGSLKMPYHKLNILEVKNAFQEMMALNTASYTNFYSRFMTRSNGFSLQPYSNQGVLMGSSYSNPLYMDNFNSIGKCFDESFYQNLDYSEFLNIQNLSNTAWPNELPNKLSSIPSAICQYSAAELYSFNASFVVPGVEFKRIVLIKDNYTNYNMPKLRGETSDNVKKRRRTSPLLIVSIISSCGMMYRVVLCDFDSAMVNHGEDKTLDEWYNWCIFRHTDQPYLYRQYAPMERRKWGESFLYRSSSLIMSRKIVKEADLQHSSTKANPQFHVVKEVLRKGRYLHVLTENNLYREDLRINCQTYTSCIDCASDPVCMWNTKDFTCVQYNGGLFRTDIFVQDVLDRGFQCAKSKMFKKNHEITEKTEMIFKCTNAGFWRDRIIWRINDGDLQENDNILNQLSNNVLIIFNYPWIRNRSNYISCHGVRDDFDLLFGGMEYETAFTGSEILLNNYTLLVPLKLTSGENSWKMLTIIFILISLILLAISVGIVLFKTAWWNRIHLTRHKINRNNINGNGLYPNPKEAALSSTICLRKAWD